MEQDVIKVSYKLIALDLDGTLLNEKNEYTSTSRNIIKKLTKTGIKVVIATGRMLVSALPFVNNLELEGPVITYNGAYIKDVKQDQVLYHKPIDYEVALQIIKDCQQLDLHLNLYQNDRLYVEENNDFSRGYEISNGVEAEEVGPLHNFIEKPPTKLLIIEEERERHQYYLKYFQEKYGEQLEIAESESHYIQFMNQGVSKGQALSYLSDYFSIPRTEIMAVGDSSNDLSMLSWAGLGVAMGNASEQAKQESDKIAPSRGEDGVTQVIKEFFDI